MTQTALGGLVAVWRRGSDRSWGSDLAFLLPELWEKILGFFMFLGDVSKLCRILSKRYLGEGFKLKHSTYDGQEGTDFDGLLGEIPTLQVEKFKSCDWA